MRRHDLQYKDAQGLTFWNRSYKIVRKAGYAEKIWPRLQTTCPLEEMRDQTLYAFDAKIQRNEGDEHCRSAG